MTAVLNALKAMDVEVVDVIAVMEKGKGKDLRWKKYWIYSQNLTQSQR